MTTRAWCQSEIAGLIALGRIGTSWEKIARDMRRGARVCEQCWHVNAKSADLRARALSRALAPEEEEVEDLLEPALPGLLRIVKTAVRFEDDPRAIAECGEPRYAPPRITSPSGPGCSAAYTAGV